MKPNFNIKFGEKAILTQNSSIYSLISLFPARTLPQRTLPPFPISFFPSIFFFIPPLPTTTHHIFFILFYFIFFIFFFHSMSPQQYKGILFSMPFGCGTGNMGFDPITLRLKSQDSHHYTIYDLCKHFHIK